MSSPDTNLAVASQNIMDIISKQQQIDKVQALLKLLEIYEIEINAVGEKHKVLNLELITEYTGKDITKYMVKNETTRKALQEVYHFNSIDDEKIIGFMDMEIMLKMTSHRRKRAQEIVNALKNEVAGTEVIPSKTRTKKFFGMI